MEHATAATLRRAALALAALGTLAAALDLLLLNHAQKPAQLIPFALLAANAAFVVALWVRPGAALLRAYRWFAAPMLTGALLGAGFHLAGNLEIARETSPGLGGANLLLEALRGGNPVLAPGLFAQIALLGLMFAHKHPLSDAPSLRAASRRRASRPQ